jgi:DNA-binding transcriptional LysR family regulator
MELRHLRYFIAVAEELNFTRAARRLGINQPPLSLQIRQLEDELGTPLFRRLTRGIELTDAGKLMLEEARVILGQVERAKIGVGRRARGETGRINLGSSRATYFHPLIPTIIRAFVLEYPNVRVIPEASNTMMLCARVRAGAIDVAFLRPPVPDRDNIEMDALVEEDSVMILPTGHRLSGAKSAPLSALAKERFIMFPRLLNPGQYDAILAACRRAGFKPLLGPESPQIISTIPLVAARLGVAIVPRSLSQIRVDGIFYLPIESDAPSSEIWLAYRPSERSQAVRNFVAVARREKRAWAENNRGAVAKTLRGG